MGRLTHLVFSMHRNEQQVPWVAAHPTHLIFILCRTAYLLRISRAMMRRWISLVPSPMVHNFTSR